MDAESLPTYYAKRALEYELVYAKPERQKDLAKIKTLLGDACDGAQVMEIACGTGYFTQAIAETAVRVDAFDINDEVLSVARAKAWPRCRPRFAIGDAYAPESVVFRDDQPVVGVAGHWWSHIPIERLDGMIATWQATLPAGSTVLWFDNRYVEGSSTPLARNDSFGNSYQSRRLSDGSVHEVLKNFPSADFLCATADRFGSAARLDWLPYYWVLRWVVER